MTSATRSIAMNIAQQKEDKMWNTGPNDIGGGYYKPENALASENGEQCKKTKKKQGIVARFDAIIGDVIRMMKQY